MPVGVAASIYLEEFAPKNRWTDLIEVNISNLAAVPSIVYGILGLAIFINFMGFPQSSSLVGALVISLMTLPTIIIATRASIRAVPPSIRDAALGHWRVQDADGVPPCAAARHAPGIMTGTILGLASALGETAPLLADRHGGLRRPTTPPGHDGRRRSRSRHCFARAGLFLGARAADPAFIERSAGCNHRASGRSLSIMNVAAILLRRKFERRW